MRLSHRRRGFTLIEILIVVSIIAVLASLILAGVNIARKKASIAVAKSNIEAMNTAIEQYVQDTGKYPAEKVKGSENGFPELFEALCVPKGKKDPYLKFKEAEVVVEDEDTESGYRQATTEEIYGDPRARKFLIDPWGRPYIYRENRSKAYKSYMHKKNGADLYSMGPDGIDQTSDGEQGPEIDDIGNW